MKRSAGRLWFASRVVGVVVLAASLAVISFAAFGKDKSELTVRPVETRTWREYGHLLVRTDPNDAASLLFKRLENMQYMMWGRPPKGSGSQFGGDIYRYTPDKGSLTIVAPNVWNQAKTPISDCSEPTSGQAWAILPPLVHDVAGKRLVFNGIPVPTSGKSVLETAVNPMNTLVAALSAEGAFWQGGFPFLGGGTASGRRFHQVFRRADATQVGKPVLLEETSRDDNIRACWSADGKTVIYYNTDFEKLWVVGVQAGAAQDKREEHGRE